MWWFDKFHRLIRSLGRRVHVEQELDEELRFHLERQIEENIARGMEPAEARRAARKEFGGMEQIKEECRDARGLQLIMNLAQDIRFGARLLARSPGFTLAAVACLAIGIGVSTMVLSSLQSMTLRELPATYRPEELVQLQLPMPYGNYEEFGTRDDLFTTLAAYQGTIPFMIEWPKGERERIWGHLATPNYFSTLGVQPDEGRVFGPEEERQGASQVVVISHRLRQRRFGGGSPLGETIRVNGQPVEVIGVAQEDFLGASPMMAVADMWIPTTANEQVAPELVGLRESRNATFSFVGRLQPGLDFDQVEAALEPLALRLEQFNNDPNMDSKERRVRMLPGGRLFPIRDEDLVASVGFSVLLTMLVLLMACGNVASMLITRASARRREIGVRLSIGAGRARLIRQLLTESLLLALLGGAAGLALARYLITFWMNLSPMLPGYVHLEWIFDWHALAYSVVVAFIAALMFGLAPALQATREDIASSLKPSAPSRLLAKRWFSLRNLVITNQVIASVVLLLITSFIVIGYRRASSFDLGFSTQNLYLLNMDPIRDGYSEERTVDYFNKLPQWLERLPGVESASLAETLPGAFTSGESIATAKVEMMGGPQSLSRMRSDRVGAGFFETAGIELIRGREFTIRDETDDSSVLVVNQTMAEQIWPGQDPLGQTVDFDGRPYEVIGVAHDLRPAIPLEEQRPEVYLPVTPSSLALPSSQGVTVVVRTQPGFDAATQLRHEATTFDPNVTVISVRPIEDLMGQALYVVNMITSVYGGIGVFALLLASMGLAAVTAYSVARRSREIGIRMALGARKGDVLWLILKEAIVLLACGAAVGLLIAIVAMKVLSSLLTAMADATSTSMSDPILLIGVPVLLIGLALLACYLPARRAVLINPAVTLKAE